VVRHTGQTVLIKLALILITRRKTMKKKIIIISIALVGFIFTTNGNAWAARERDDSRYHDRGGYHQKWDKRADHHYGWKQSPHQLPGRHHFKPKPPRRDHRPVYRKFHPKRYDRRAHRPVVKQINNYYGSVESDSVAEDDYRATASISDAEFSFSIGVSGSR
jgi:hypothetical protein